jgi:LPS export ABC transporter protein LptC
MCGFKNKKLIKDLIISKIKYLYLIQVLFLYACTDQKPPEEVNYTGPSLELENIELVYGDSAQVQVKMKTAIEQDMQNQDKIYPKEVRLYFYDDYGKERTTIRSDSGRYYKSSNEYKLMGNILINDNEKNQNLTTTELKWLPDKKIIFTTKPVDLHTPSQTLHGMGLTANQDFTQYSLGSSSGLINLPK